MEDVSSKNLVEVGFGSVDSTAHYYAVGDFEIAALVRWDMKCLVLYKVDVDIEASQISSNELCSALPSFL